MQDRKKSNSQIKKEQSQHYLDNLEAKWKTVFTLLTGQRQKLVHPLGSYSYASVSKEDVRMLSCALEQQYSPDELSAQLKELIERMNKEIDSASLQQTLDELECVVHWEACRLRYALEKMNYPIKIGQACALLEKYVVEHLVSLPQGLLYQLHCSFVAASNRSPLKMQPPAFSLPVMEPGSKDTVTYLSKRQELPECQVLAARTEEGKLPALPLGKKRKLASVSDIDKWSKTSLFCSSFSFMPAPKLSIWQQMTQAAEKEKQAPRGMKRRHGE